MTAHYALEAAKREQAGKGVARALRREKKIPAVVYGDGKEPVKISLPANEINVEYRKGHMFTSLCDLNLEGAKQLVLARDIQLHPVSDVVTHVDFLRVNDKTKIAVFVPVHFINEEKSPGLHNKGVLNIVRHEVELYCSATNIPDHLEVDLNGKDIGDTIHISDAKMPADTTPVIDNRNFTIATINAPRQAEEEPVAAAEGEAAEGAAAAEGGEKKDDAKKGDEKKPEAKKEG